MTSYSNELENLFLGEYLYVGTEIQPFLTKSGSRPFEISSDDNHFDVSCRKFDYKSELNA